MRISDWSSDVCSSDLVGGVVLVARGGEVIFRRAAGFADREAGIPMREDSIFLLASLTKPIVTAAIMRLVEQHRIELDAHVTDWRPDFQPKTADGTTPVIPIRQLLTHTARTEEHTSELHAPMRISHHVIGWRKKQDNRETEQ